ncbi:hypothetical protein LTS18_004624 [Coniosporium uncinatum]|uniref:Uncharacterized protein n=1 Tax=Coniosporium uncinatum TaxID=93489 RepID=A0ACC3DBI8_9PEZI|nr:hypothetical protein LTS18_004624 [Coniosporium uncinatum]
MGYTGPGGNATVQSNLPQATYEASIAVPNFDTASGTTISGSVVGATSSNGTGVTFMINLSGFPSVAEYGPFVYHIHQMPIGSDGNCTAAMAHLDPTQRGELHACQATAPQTCQAGDLAGKHGNITSTTWNVSYTDPYLSTDPSSPYFFGNRSFVVHSSNATRLACGNFTQMSASNSTGGGSSSSGSTTGGSGMATASTEPFTGAGSTWRMQAGGVVLFAVTAALLLL